MDSLIQLVSVGDAKQVNFGISDILGMIEDSGYILDEVIYSFGKKPAKTTG